MLPLISFETVLYGLRPAKPHENRSTSGKAELLTLTPLISARLDLPPRVFRAWQENTNSIFCSRPLAGLRQQMEVWFYLKEEPRLRSQHTRRRTRKNLHPRSSEARRESLCPLDKDLSWKSEKKEPRQQAVVSGVRHQPATITKTLGLQSLSGPPYRRGRQHYGHLS